MWMEEKQWPRYNWLKKKSQAKNSVHTLLPLFVDKYEEGQVLYIVQFSLVQSLSHVWLFATPWTAARQASLSITNSRSLPKLMSIELVMPSNHLILCRPHLLPPLIFPSIRVFSSESVLCIRLQLQLQHQSFQWTLKTDFL